MRYLLVILLLSGCSSWGDKFAEVKEFCESRGGFHDGNPINFSCKDSSQWKRCSHDGYDFKGR